MIDSTTFSKMALQFPNTEQVAHFERIGFKVIGKRMFATHLAKDNTATIFLSPREQKVFCRMDKANIYPVPNKWGEKGATIFLLDNVAHYIVSEAMLSAYNDILPKRTTK